jgi:hypothetical protein
MIYSTAYKKKKKKTNKIAKSQQEKETKIHHIYRNNGFGIANNQC